jgi:hypothetical protein
MLVANASRNDDTPHMAFLYRQNWRGFQCADRPTGQRLLEPLNAPF